MGFNSVFKGLSESVGHDIKRNGDYSEKYSHTLLVKFRDTERKFGGTSSYHPVPGDQ
jgi:hypothetical protein